MLLSVAYAQWREYPDLFVFLNVKLQKLEHRDKPLRKQK